MNPSQCSIILVDGCITQQQKGDTLSILQSLYNDVEIVSNSHDALTTLHNRQKRKLSNETKPTLLLIDVDENKMDSNGEIHSKECLGMIKTIMKELHQGNLHDTIPIVCSCREDPEFMLECLCHGAADYIVKPLKTQVIKTLFLNVYRYRISRPQIGTDPSPVYVTTSSPPQQEPGKIWPFFENRLKGVFMKENWLQKTVFDYYAPEPSVRRSSMSSMTSEKTKYLQSRICNWDFLPLDVEDKDLVQSVCLILTQILEHPDLAEFRVSDDEMYTFVFDIYNSYHNSNPYHNFRHAVDVLQSTYYFLCKMGVLEPMDKEITDATSACHQEGYMHRCCSNEDKDELQHHRKLCKDLLQPMDILGLLMASLGHDVGHPGVTNMFMIQSGTPLAVLYNDRSVLESYHSMAFFHLLGKSCFSKLINVKMNSEWKRFRKVVVHCILATDMGMHDDYVQRIEKQAKNWHDYNVNLHDDSVKEQERLTICGALIKCADIGNCARPFPLAKKWAEILAEEFARQGDLEKELGLPILPINERGKVSLGEFQLTFERNIALKLYRAVADVVPGMAFCLDFIYENIDIWQNNQVLDSGLGRSEANTDNDEDEDVDIEDHNTLDNDYDRPTPPAPKRDIEITPYTISSSSSTLPTAPPKENAKKVVSHSTVTTSSLTSDQMVENYHPTSTKHRQDLRESPSALCHCTIQ
ncbi:hypothetical protein BDA99DRAFT_515078 [Phascolomyces articulosus]|uniref:Phosphodiesterase n=1 Tax=Phascolomyces articulosus TaxID=60185 RepID=A0AAD5JWT6_9FUNG|nr:hypothetical protein BDA99DRAFT_515078 [Phascolomyces articulosus]